MVLTPITHTDPESPPGTQLPAPAELVIRQTRVAYDIGGYEPPWIGYLALADDECVGTCAFKTKPAGGQVEIAYYTFPGHQGRGFASQMAAELVKIAIRQQPRIRIVAQTLPEESASTKVLKKNGFTFQHELDHIEDGRVWQWQWQGG